MPTHDIIDNRTEKLVDHLALMLGTSERARFAVGYLFLSGLTSVAKRLLNLKELRLLIGNTTNRETVEMLAEGYRRLDLAAEEIEKQVYPKRTEAGKMAQETAGNLRNSVELMDQTDEGQDLIAGLIRMIEEKRLKVRVFTKGRLHAKAYICDYGKVFDLVGKEIERHEKGIAVVGSSNLTLAGLTHNTELNVVVQGNQNHTELAHWFDDLWKDSQEFDETLEVSGECTPYDAKRLAGWNPYDTNTHAPFFDPGWMFGLTGRDRSPSGPNGRLGEASLPADGGPFDVVIGNPPYVRQEELKNQTVIGSDGKPQPLKDALKGQYECFTGTADLYVYFFERSLQLLHPGGVLSFITSNKYFHAAYGERLRTYLAYATRPSVVLDFGDAPVFTSIAYPAIIVTQKTRSVELGKLPKNLCRDGGPSPSENGRLGEASLPFSRVMTWAPGPDIREFPDIFERDAFALAQGDLKSDGWRMENPISLRLLERLRKAGTPLGEYVQGRFYYGIKTGLNEAFVVDRETRDRLISDHKSSAEVLKPFLRGRDVKRWRCEPQDLWLLFTRRGIDIKKYPAIHEHLKQFKKQLTPGIPGGRKPGSYEWYEIQDNIAYWQEFEQPKIIVPAIEDEVNYAPDTAAFFSNDKTSIIIPSSVPLTLAVVNSSVSWWITRQAFASKQGGFYEFKPMYVSTLSIPPIPPDKPHWQALCERLAEALIWLHSPAAKKVKDAPTGLMIAYLEQWLNGLVYELFFPGELRARRLKLFDETAKMNPPDLAKFRAADKLAALQELHDKAYAKDATLRTMLFDLKSLDVVRVIEDVDVAPIGAETPEETEE